jgi:hypothetical protein
MRSAAQKRTAERYKAVGRTLLFRDPVPFIEVFSIREMDELITRLNRQASAIDIAKAGEP